MREIKFRAWDKSNDMMREIIEIRFNNDGRIKSVFPKPTEKEEFYGECNDWPNDYELMQYTGRKDKDGVEIYEGDIVNIDYGDGYDWKEEVIFNRGCFMAGDDALLHNVLPSAKVLGNRYENPELLEGNQ